MGGHKMSDLREKIAELEFDMDWDEENNYAMLNASNGLWQEQTDEWFRSHCYRRADKILTAVADAVEKTEIHLWYAWPATIPLLARESVAKWLLAQVEGKEER